MSSLLLGVINIPEAETIATGSGIREIARLRKRNVRSTAYEWYPRTSPERRVAGRCSPRLNSCTMERCARTLVRGRGALGRGQDQSGEGADGARAAAALFRLLHHARAARQRDRGSRLSFHHARTISMKWSSAANSSSTRRYSTTSTARALARCARHWRQGPAAAARDRLAGRAPGACRAAGGAQHLHSAADAPRPRAAAQGAQHRLRGGDPPAPAGRAARHRALDRIRLRRDQRPLRAGGRGFAGHRARTRRGAVGAATGGDAAREGTAGG